MFKNQRAIALMEENQDIITVAFVTDETEDALCLLTAQELLYNHIRDYDFEKEGSDEIVLPTDEELIEECDLNINLNIDLNASGENSQSVNDYNIIDIDHEKIMRIYNTGIDMILQRYAHKDIIIENRYELDEKYRFVKDFDDCLYFEEVSFWKKGEK